MAVRAGVTLNDGRHDLAACTVPTLYHIHKVEGSGPQARYWLAGDVSGWARQADLLTPADTLRALVKLIRQCPCDPALYLARGLVEAGIGRFLPAIADFDDVLRLDPWCANAYYYRALANKEIDERDRAIGDLYEAIRLQPDNPAFYFARAVVEEARRHRLRAIEDYTTALRLDPTNQQAEAALDRLAGEDQSAATARSRPGTAAKAAPAAAAKAAPAPDAKKPAASDAKKATDSSTPSRTPLQVALEQAAIEEANARAAEARARSEELRARIEEARARAEKAMLDAERFRRERTQR